MDSATDKEMPGLSFSLFSFSNWFWAVASRGRDLKPAAKLEELSRASPLLGSDYQSNNATLSTHFLRIAYFTTLIQIARFILKDFEA